MLTAVESTITAIVFVVQVLPIGTNVGLLRIMWAMLNGSFLGSRGAVHSALAANDFAPEEIRRSWAALRYGAWAIEELIAAWQVYVAAGNAWRARRYAGYRVKSIDITAFWRPRLAGQVNKHYHAVAQKALPAMVFGVLISAGEIKGKRIPLLHSLVRCAADLSETAFRQALLKAALKTTQADEITVVDAGFELSELQATQTKRFVVRMASNCTARRNQRPTYKGKGARPKYGQLVRPLPRRRLETQLAATPSDTTGTFGFADRTLRYETWHELVTTTTGAAADNPTFTIHVFYDPLYQKPLLLATDLGLNAELIYLIYRDRWPVEHPPLAAKQMLGCHRQFVFAPEACFRLPELALLVGNMLTYLAAILPPSPAGFWDRTPKATPGRLRRLLARANFPNLADFEPELRKKNAVSDHLPKGVDAHRRRKPVP
jgi:hypothetical protein